MYITGVLIFRIIVEFASLHLEGSYMLVSHIVGGAYMPINTADLHILNAEGEHDNAKENILGRSLLSAPSLGGLSMLREKKER